MTDLDAVDKWTYSEDEYSRRVVRNLDKDLAEVDKHKQRQEFMRELRGVTARIRWTSTVNDETTGDDSPFKEINMIDAMSLPLRSVIVSVDHDTSYDDEHPANPGVLTNRGWRFGDHHYVQRLPLDSRWLLLKRGPDRAASYVIDVTWRRDPEPCFVITIPAVNARVQLADDSPRVGPEFRKNIRSYGRRTLADRLRLDPTDCPPSQMKYDGSAENRLRGDNGESQRVTR